MRVYYVSNQYDGCQYVRCLMPTIHNGFSGDRESLRMERMPLSESAKMAMSADVVVFHRPDEEQRLKSAILLKKMGKKIVFDNDDTFKDIGELKHGKYYLQKNKILDDFIRIADLVTTTTEFLADEYRQLNKNVVVLPNCIDEDDWSRPLRNEGDKVRIGIFGSATLNGDYDSIKDVLKQLGKRDDVQLVMFGLPKKELQVDLIKELYSEEINFWGSLNIEWHPLVVIADYFDKLNSLRLDIALIPRKDNYFNRCKSNLKFLEASMLEIPVVAQSFDNSPYEEIRHGDNGILIKDNKDWMKEINGLIKDKKKRRWLGISAKYYVLNKYNIINNASKWRQAYENIK